MNDKNDYIGCISRDETPSVASDPVVCVFCEAPLWRATDSIRERPDIRPLCMPCTIKALSDHADIEIQPPTESQITSIMEVAGLTREQVLELHGMARQMILRAVGRSS